MNFAPDHLLKSFSTALPALFKKRGQSSSIGLYLGKDALNMVQMENTGGLPQIRALAVVPYPCPRDDVFQNPKVLKDLVKQACAMQPFKGRRIVSCLPARAIKIITVAYKTTKDQSDTEALVAELQERLHDELNNMVLDFIPLRYEQDESNNSEALVALAPRQGVMSYLNLFTEAGLDVEALDVGPSALARLVRHSGARAWPAFPLMPNALLINIGAESSFLTVIWGRRLILDRAIDFSENRMLLRLKNVLNLTDEMAESLLFNSGKSPDGQDEAQRMVAEVLHPEMTLLLQEINKTLVYMASKTRGKSINVAYLAGSATRYLYLLNGLEKQLQVPVQTINSVSIFAPDNKKFAFDESLGAKPGIALATGLALRGVPEHG